MHESEKWKWSRSVVSIGRDHINSIFFSVYNYWYITSFSSVQFISVTQSCPTLCNPMNLNSQASLSIINSRSSFRLASIESVIHATIFCPPLSPRVGSDSHPLGQWCYLTISSSAAPFSWSKSFPASRSFPLSLLFASSGKSIGASASGSVLLMSIQGWFPWGRTHLISMLSKGISRVFYSTTIGKYQFFGAQPCLWPTSYIPTWPLEKP